MTEEKRAARYTDLFERSHEHETPDCAYCPICSGISVIRQTKPEMLDHVAAAVRELIAAAGIFLAEAEKIVAKIDSGNARSDQGPSEAEIHHLGTTTPRPDSGSRTG